MDENLYKLILIILCVVFPPAAVALAGAGFWAIVLNVLLTFLGLYVCGLLHALWVVANRNKA